MKSLLIIKTGTTVALAAREGGDFEEWIAHAAGFRLDECITCNVMQGELLPDADTVGGVIITGSAAMVSDRLPWSEYAAAWLKQVADSGLPVLGICYGHQLLAHALGGVVDFHPLGREIGTTGIRQLPPAHTDPLFNDVPQKFAAHVSHMQSVRELPADAIVLACNEFEPYHAVRFREQIWGVQFHPEFSRQIMLAYLEEREARLIEEGLNVQVLREQVTETPEAVLILRNFGRLLLH